MTSTLTINLARSLIYVNAGSLKMLPCMEHALLLISSSEKRLRIIPCESGELNAVRLRTGSLIKIKSRHIRCYKEFVEQMLDLTGWSRDFRYRITGYTSIYENNSIITFDLSAPERFPVSDISKGEIA